MLDIKLSFAGSGFDFFAVSTLFNVKKFCLITLQKSDLRKRNGVQEAAGSTPVTRTNENSHHSVAAVFYSGDRDQRPLANSNPPLGVPNAKRRHAAGSTPVTPTNMNSRHSVAAVFSFRRKGTGGKFKFVTDLPDIVLTCALQQNRQTKARKFANFHYSSGKQNVV